MSPLFRSAALVLFCASHALGQTTTTAINPLNQFIDTAGSAASVINSARVKETAAAASASAASASAAAASNSAKSGHGHRNTIIAAVCGVVGAVLLLAILLGICCVLRRHRRRRRDRKAVHDDEKTIHHSQPTPPLNPGRTYAPLAQNRGGVPTTSKPQLPPVVTSVGPSGLNHDPARGSPNPFVPVPPSPRKPAFSNSAFINTTPRDSYDKNSYVTHPHDPHSTAQPYLAETSPLRATTPRSRSNSRPRSGVGVPIVETAERIPTPVGVNRIGQPYDDRHVSVLRTGSPSSDLRRSVYGSDPVQRHHTPPFVPSRSPGRHVQPAAVTAFHSSTTNSSTTNSSSDEDWRRSQAGTSGASGWTSTPTRYSNGTSGAVLPPPPVPWDHTQPRHHSGGHSPRSSMGQGAPAGWTPGHDRRGSATSINGQPRRMRFPDLTVDGGHGNTSGNGTYTDRDDARYSPVVVGEAL